MFGVVDKVIETGQDPRRFTEDLLRRLRDLVIVSAVPDAPATGLIDIAEDAAERLVAQAARFGPAELSRAADLVATGLTEMRGATAPRLLLELICARVLLPGADHSTEGVQARLDRLERRMTIAGGDPAPLRRPSPTRRAGRAAGPRRSGNAEPVVAAPPPVTRSRRPARRRLRRRPSPPRAHASPSPPPSRPRGGPGGARARRPRPPSPRRAPTAGRARVRRPVTETAAGSPLSLVDVRRLWPDIVEATKQRRRVTWIHLTQHAQVVAVDAQVLTLGFGNVGARESFDNGGSAEIVRQAAIDVVGHDWRVETIVDPGAEPAAAPPPAAARPPAAAPAVEAAAPSAAAPADDATRRPPSPSRRRPRAPRRRPARRSRPTRSRRARASPRPSRRPTPTAAPAPTTTTPSPPGSTAPSSSSRRSGAQVIEEIPHQ